MTRVTLICTNCGYTCRRELSMEPGSRGVHETSSEPGLCPNGHGLLVRKDGLPQERWALWKGNEKFMKQPVFEKGDKVQHRKTNRVGVIHSKSRKHPGWLKVVWEGDSHAYRYEPEDLVHSKDSGSTVVGDAQ